MSYVYVVLDARSEQVIQVFAKKYRAKGWLSRQPNTASMVVQSWRVSDYHPGELVRTTPGDFFRDETK